jgi:hypothetical protein
LEEEIFVVVDRATAIYDLRVGNTLIKNLVIKRLIWLVINGSLSPNERVDFVGI